MRLGLQIWILLSALLAFSSGLLAKGLDAEMDKYIGACAATLSDIETSTCLGKQYALADGVLNQTWREVVAKIDATPAMPDHIKHEWRMIFSKGQRFWVRYRDAECRGSVPFGYKNGSKASVGSLGCFLRTTVARINELRTYLDH